MQNVEFKSELRDLPLARNVCRSMGASLIGELRQTDTYFRIPNGRLKKRETEGEPTEWVFYERPNRITAKVSNFTIYSEHRALERFGRVPLPVWVVVRKVRELWLIANARIHLDQVETLGRFLEFEALVSRDCDVEAARGCVGELRAAFGPCLGEAIDCSYSDLLARDSEGAAGDV